MLGVRHGGDTLKEMGIKVPRSKHRGGPSLETIREEEREEHREVEMDSEEEGEEGGDMDRDISWAPKMSAKRKERDDFWIDAELTVRRVCGYRERSSKKVNKRVRERELGGSRDIREMLDREEEDTPSEEEGVVEGEVDFREEGDKITKKLLLGWDSLTQSWQQRVMQRAKGVRSCHRKKHIKTCDQCNWSRKVAQREWENDHKDKVQRTLSTKRYRQSNI